MSSLFDAVDETKRRQLRRLGWKPIFHPVTGAVDMWERPDESRVTEAEAFRQLDALQVLESDREVE